MSSQQQPRIDAGVPDGGRFATTGRQDSGSDVLNDDTEIQTVAQLAAALAQLPLWSHQSAKHWGIRRRVPIEDLEQEIVAQFLQTLASRRKADGGALSGRNQQEILNPAYVHGLSRRVAANMAAGGKSSIEQAALREFRSARERFTTANSRQMTTSETDALGEEIRVSFPAGDRPAAGFYRNPIVFSIEADEINRDRDGSDPRFGVETKAYEYAARMGGEQVDQPEFADDSLAAGALKAAEVGGKPGQAAIEGLAWNAIAEQVGAPAAVLGAIRDDRAAVRVRADISALVEATARQAPGYTPGPQTRKASVVDVVHAWENGDLSDEEMEPVFRPFGGSKLAADESDGICRVLKLAGRQRSDELLDLAVRAARTPRPQKVKTNA